MEKLETIICPTIALITNIGEAHSEGFASKEEKKKEKEILLRNALQPPPLHSITVEKKAGHATITALKNPVQPETIRINIPFTDDASIDNAISCWRILLMLGYDNAVIDARMKYLQPINMRLELKKGVNGCSVINDSYSADISSLEIALDFLEQQGSGQKRTVILSDFLQSSMDNRALYTFVLEQLKRHQVNRLIGIGEHIAANLPTSPPGLQVESFVSTDDFIRHFRFSTFKDEVILVKGARIFAFERIVKLLEQKVHETVLEINLSGIVHNLKQYQHHLHPSTKVMAMVKAFAYGSGGAEIAGILQYHKVDYLGVAYADEGVELRKAGVILPIMVMNPEDSAFDAIVEYGLEPELYSIEMLKAFDEFLKQEGIQHYPVHIEIETGMNRLGFSPQDIHTLAQSIKATASFRVMSAFSHLAASEEPEQDAFTGEQFHLFNQASLQLQEALGYPFIRHIANSAAAIRHPHLQLDMVRLGIGLYGVDSASTGQLHLQPVATLKSTIAQIKHLKKGDSVSYNRRLIVDRDTTIATIRIGYADGYPRRLGNGRGKVLLRGQEVPVSGTICMDMFMVDITSVPAAQEGDEVVLFGKQLPVQQVAKWAETIPYEIMTGISQRVKRVYFQE